MNLSKLKDEFIENFIEKGILDCLLQHLNHPLMEIRHIVVHILSNLLASSPVNIEIILNEGFLRKMVENFEIE